MVEAQMMTVTHLLLLLQWDMAIMKTFILNRVIVQEYHAPAIHQRLLGSQSDKQVLRHGAFHSAPWIGM